jgi:hypothetical protein
MTSDILTAVIPAAVTLLAVALTLFFTNRREAKGLEHERELQREQGEEQRFTKLREERLKAYADLNRMTAFFNTYGGTADVREGLSQLENLKRAYSEIELLTDDQGVLDAAADLVAEAVSTVTLLWGANRANPGQNPYQNSRVKEALRTTAKHRVIFIAEARRELEYKPPTQA